MLAIERKNEILDILQKEQRVLVSELSQRYNVTEETIRRDLEKLEKEGFVKKTYGGAVLNKSTNIDLPLRIREKTNREEKQDIAQAAAALIEEGDSIMLDSSSTSLMIAKNLKNMNKLTVITNSVEVLLELTGCEGVTVISTGGILRESSLSLVGKNAEKLLDSFSVDKAIVSCKGLGLHKGIMESNEQEAAVKVAMRNNAEKLILAADSSKFDSLAFVKVMDLQKGDVLVTDKLPDKKWQKDLQEKGVEIIIPKE